MIIKILRKIKKKFFDDFKSSLRIGNQFKEWEKNGYGYPVPPHHIIKEITVAEYQKKYGYNILIETGTCFGDMVEAQKNNFKKIYSIELDKILYEKAKNRFKDLLNISIINGDSGKILSNIISELKEPSLFWLDAHYSGGFTAKGDKNCPIFEELDAIFESELNGHAILIDDARLFVGKNDYPKIDYLTEYFRKKNKNYIFTVKDDILRFEIGV